MAELPEDVPAIVLGSAGWPMGIVGLVAGRLTERYARPSFIVCLNPDEAKGSARTIPGVHMVQALDCASAPLLRYGGHKVAAGFSLDPSRFEEFAEVVSAAVAGQLGDPPREKLSGRCRSPPPSAHRTLRPSAPWSPAARATSAAPGDE